MGLFDWLKRKAPQVKTDGIAPATPQHAGGGQSSNENVSISESENNKEIPTVKFNKDKVTQDIIEIIENLITESKEIPEDKRSFVFTAASEAVSRGRDMHMLYSALSEIGIEKARAEELTRKIINRSSAKIQRNDLMAIGVTQCQWVYSGPCWTNKKPTTRDAKRDELHRAADGKLYDIRKGLKVGSRHIFPGEIDGCGCMGRMVMPETYE